jgi:hypothetical protein
MVVTLTLNSVPVDLFFSLAGVIKNAILEIQNTRTRRIGKQESGVRNAAGNHIINGYVT